VYESSLVYGESVGLKNPYPWPRPLWKRPWCWLVGHELEHEDPPGVQTYPNWCHDCGMLLVGRFDPPGKYLDSLPPPAEPRKYRLR
jgi:hypothetical protein